MNQKSLMDSQLNSVLAIAQFDQGSRYQDFDPSVDEVAAYGIGVLIAGKVLAKIGFFAAELIFVKKFGLILVFIVGAVGARLWKWKKTS